MIRRDIRLADGSAAWMLISQIEHARISGELARHCAAPLDPASRDEVVAAIGHHDDGWAAWEAAPQFDPADGRPLSFTEVSSAVATGIWSRSIDAAERIGPLAASMVAGHFLRLARHEKSTPAQPAVAAWRTAVEARRRKWIAAWLQVDSARPAADAVPEAALEWLWTFDEASLWLCCTCTGNEPIPCAPQPYRAGQGTPLEMDLAADDPERATARPWRFVPGQLEITIAGQVVPARRYCEGAEMLAAASPQTLRWRLFPG